MSDGMGQAANVVERRADGHQAASPDLDALLHDRADQGVGRAPDPLHDDRDVEHLSHAARLHEVAGGMRVAEADLPFAEHRVIVDAQRFAEEHLDGLVEDLEIAGRKHDAGRIAMPEADRNRMGPNGRRQVVTRQGSGSLVSVSAMLTLSRRVKMSMAATQCKRLTDPPAGRIFILNLKYVAPGD